jgi:hypothetical protein
MSSKADTKNKPTSFADLIAESVPEQVEVTLGKQTMWVRELSGRERWDAAEKADDANQWEVMLWLCDVGIVSPRPTSIDELEKIKPQWIKIIAAAIMKLSGMTMEDVEDAEKGSAAVIDIGGS